MTHFIEYHYFTLEPLRIVPVPKNQLNIKSKWIFNRKSIFYLKITLVQDFDSEGNLLRGDFYDPKTDISKFMSIWQLKWYQMSEKLIYIKLSQIMCLLHRIFFTYWYPKRNPRLT